MYIYGCNIIFVVLCAFFFQISANNEAKLVHLINDISSKGIAVERYDGDKVFRIWPITSVQLEELNRAVRFNSKRLSFWKPVSTVGKVGDVHVKKESVIWFKQFLKHNGIRFKIHVEDIQKMIETIDTANELSRQKDKNDSIVGHFVSHDSINAWLASVCKAHPKIATCGLGGITYNNRQIRYIRLGTQTVKNVTKPNILIVGGIHAREWLSPATLVHIINQFVTKYYNNDAVVKRMLHSFNWYIMPVINPDGYEYSRYSDRLWRKTRSKVANSTCVGVDGNRNFDFHWGSSDGPCSGEYPGPRAMSEVEVMSISDFTKIQKLHKLLAFFSVHTYSQLWMLPYGYKRGARPPDYDELLRVGKIGIEALMAVNRQHWQCGNIVDELYVAAGNSVDWFKHTNARYSFVLELRGDGFIVPESEIDPSGREVFAGFIAAVAAMKAAF